MKIPDTTFQRILKMALPPHQSAFLWGARKTGKSTYLRKKFAGSHYIDLLNTQRQTHYLKNPHHLYEELTALPVHLQKMPIIIDEIQKVPLLLDEVHALIEDKKLSFILCGSSARKLKRGAANLLGGRAWSFHMYPLCCPEIPDIDLLALFNTGGIPSHYANPYAKRALRAYINEYIREEIQAEGLVRNLAAFSTFIDALGFCNGQMINYSNIARDCGVDSKTVKEYFQILVDTLLGYSIQPYKKTVQRDIIRATPKFYLFDVGVATYLAHQTIETLKGAHAGAALEHYILTELIAYREFKEQDYPIRYWRTKTGIEVDFILDQADVAIEVKISRNVDKRDIKGLTCFIEEHQPRLAIIVSQDELPRNIIIDDNHTIQVMPWRYFLKRLWDGKIK